MANFSIDSFNLLTTPEPTGKQLGKQYTNFVDAVEGEEYSAEFTAMAMDYDDRYVMLHWIQTMLKGSEPELDELNWDIVHSITWL
ncbi:hypothetical protein D3C81_375610 [compost metagenome]